MDGCPAAALLGEVIALVQKSLLGIATQERHALRTYAIDEVPARHTDARTLPVL